MVWDIPLKQEFRLIYNLALNKLRLVMYNFDLEGGGFWAPRVRRNLNDW